ncbi:MAG: DNA mismatch repair protein MutS [Myxococcales bacterium]|nr:DNA mismatch repair protein MutS [Myxococcales bacterium]
MANSKGHSPVILQFLKAKEQYPDALLFFRLGDFYELFFDDAVRASELLGIVQSFRGKDPDGNPIPMAGVPHHAASGYLTRLLRMGQKVAICEQMADPSTVKGVVPREVVRVITPGLCLEPDALDDRAEHLLAALYAGRERVGLCAFDLSTGALRACDLPDVDAALAELVRLDPRELLLPELSGPLHDAVRAQLENTPGQLAPASEAGLLAEVLGSDQAADTRAAFSAEALRAIESVIAYASASQPGTPLSVQRVGHYDPSEQLILDEAAVRNLEIVRTLAGERQGSLLHHLDVTKTPMGARLLRRRLLAPLTAVGRIRRRHDKVEALVGNAALRGTLRATLAAAGDLERLATRVAMNSASPRDLGAIRASLCAAEALAAQLVEGGSGFTDDPLSDAVPRMLRPALRAQLERELVEDPPTTSRAGGIVRPGVDPELDELRGLSETGKDVLLALEQREREATGIGSLKIRFNKVFGYFFEVTRSNLGAVPAHFVRKQTVANAERFVTEELVNLEERILTADDRAKALEEAHFERLCEAVRAEADALRALSSELAVLDVHAALAEVAHRFDYVRPEVDTDTALELLESRHPIVERLSAAGEFVPNDVLLDSDGPRLMVLTGPNMAGKSTAMRQVALAVILAQAGGFVPAAKARIGVVDRVFTRVGASDNLSRGQSTFMVEMTEAASILRGASARSLVILDEIGRGTSTYDGLSIAWAVAEHLHDAIGCRAIFATHYHELCELADTRPGVVNFNVAAREHGESVVFLHKLVPGGANRSYGIAVARLAGVPPIVLARAKTLLQDLEKGAALPSGAHARMRPLDDAGKAQLSLFVPASEAKRGPSAVERTLAELDVDRMTPLDALVALARLRALLDDTPEHS